MKIIVIEDELDLCQTIEEGLRLSGYAVDSCNDGEEALEMIQVENYDLILLDLNLPHLDGMDILKQFRETNTSTPVLILSARGSIDDKVQGLDYGANDYLSKPFHFKELEARIRSLLRRKFSQEHSVLTYQEISFNTINRTAYIHQEPLSLTRKEAALLEYLILNQERIISQEELIDHLWDNRVNSFSNSIRVHISSLRKKLKTALGYDPIQNKVGEGYQLGGNNK